MLRETSQRPRQERSNGYRDGGSSHGGVRVYLVQVDVASVPEARAGFTLSQ